MSRVVLYPLRFLLLLLFLLIILLLLLLLILPLFLLLLLLLLLHSLHLLLLLLILHLSLLLGRGSVGENNLWHHHIRGCAKLSALFQTELFFLDFDKCSIINIIVRLIEWYSGTDI